MTFHRITISPMLFLVLSVGLSGLWLPGTEAQRLPTQEDLCPDYREVDPLQECTSVRSYAGLKSIIEETPAGGSVDLCPFFVQKVSSLDPIIIRKGVTVRCVRKTPDDLCIINGMGHQVWIDTDEDTLWQGFSFRGSDDHAVYIVGDVDNADVAAHTFCQVSFENNVRNKETRGGALMAEPSSGTLNVVQCLFKDNFSVTYGSAIYSRTNQLNVVNSIFVKNRSNGFGGAIFTAKGASLMIRGSQFLSNRGREEHDVVYNPQQGTEIFQDGFGNSMNDGACKGVFDLTLGSCYVFTTQTISPTRQPTNQPTKQPTVPPTVGPKKGATSPRVPAPTNQLVPPPSEQPTSLPVPTSTSTPASALVPSKAPTTFRPTSSTQINGPTDASVSANNRPTPASPPLSLTEPPNTPPPTSKISNPPQIPSTNPAPVVLSPTREVDVPERPVLAPSRQPSQNVYGGQETAENATIPSMCTFAPFEGECVQVETFKDFEAAILEGGDEIVFCGGFSVQKVKESPLRITEDVDIRCLEMCTIFGVGPLIQIGGAMSKVRFSNIKFMMTRLDSAVLVSAMTSLSQTTFCNSEFEGNNLRMGKHGGAINIDERSGVVNVVGSTFTDNSASRGGAIYSKGYSLNLIESRFVANHALNIGNAIFVAENSEMTVKSSTFLLNRLENTGGSGPLSQDYVIAVEPTKSIRTPPRTNSFVDAGKNRVIMSGDCNGFFNLWDQTCEEFTPMISR